MTQNRILTCGCFDILHTGHYRFLQFCIKMKELYQAEFWIALDSNERIKNRKGNNRPIFSYIERCKMLLETFPEIDGTWPFGSDDDLKHIIKNFDPILIESERWRGNVVGEDLAKKIIYAPEFPSLSTTDIIHRILDKNL